MTAHQLTGLCCAAALACSINVSAQTSAGQSSSEPATAPQDSSSSPGDTSPTPSSADPATDDTIVTVVGCVQSESAALGTSGPGKSNEFVLTNATMGAADSASASSTSPSSVGTSGTESATGAAKPEEDAKGTEPESASPSAGTAVGTSGVSPGAVYGLTGSQEGELARFVGKRVEITGKLERTDGAASPSESSPSPDSTTGTSDSSSPYGTSGTSGTTADAGSSGAPAAVQQLDITRYREIGGSCDSTIR